MYMRTELKKLEKFGGAPLLQPLFTVFNSTPNTTTLSDVSRVMFGYAVMVAFAFEKGQVTKDIVFPQSEWVNLRDFETIAANHARHVPFGVKDGLPMYQRAGTIVPL